MIPVVVDASVAVKWLNEEEHSDAARALLEDGGDLYAPDFLMLEVDSVISKWIRRGMISRADAQDVRSFFARIPLHTYPCEALRDSAYDVAVRTGLSVYDCLYVALAIVLDCKVVTADRRAYNALMGGPLANNVRWVEDVSQTQ